MKPPSESEFESWASTIDSAASRVKRSDAGSRPEFAHCPFSGVPSLPPGLRGGGLRMAMSPLSEKVMNLPAAPGVYLFKNPVGKVLYVGKAKSLTQRVRNYLAADLADPRLRELMGHATDLDVVLTDTEVEALLLEAT